MPVNADPLELHMLSLINEEREARGLNPLKLETNLNMSAEEHSQWMLGANVFSHTGQGGSSATARIAEELDLTGSWRTAENIAIQSIRGEPGLLDDVEDLHNSLMNSPGHRANILNPNLEYIGLGIELGEFTYSSGATLQSLIVTQNFATTSAEVNLDPGVSASPLDAPDPLPVPDPTPEVSDPVPEADDPAPQTPVAENPQDIPVAEAPAPSEPENTDNEEGEAERPVAQVPVDETPVAEAPVEETPVAEAPVEETPVAEAPVEETPVAEAPAEETPVAEAPAEETPVAEAPAEETPVAEAPAEETPVAEAPVEETPVAEAPVEETPVAEAPVEETPVAEAPVEETPVAEIPQEEVYDCPIFAGGFGDNPFLAVARFEFSDDVFEFREDENVFGNFSLGDVISRIVSRASEFAEQQDQEIESFEFSFSFGLRPGNSELRQLPERQGFDEFEPDFAAFEAETDPGVDLFS